LDLSPSAFTAAAQRLAKKGKLANARHEFYLILRPEDQNLGAPDPVRWIDPLMRYQRTDYRISLLRAAAFHGASHQAAMVFQIVVPKQLRSLELDGSSFSSSTRHRRFSSRRIGRNGWARFRLLRDSQKLPGSN